MELSCTKKLADELGVKLADMESRTPFYDWHAHIITKNRRKMLVLLNNHTHYIVTVYGVRAADLKKLPQLVLDSIRHAFREMGFTDDAIEQYIACLGDVQFVKTDRSLISSMNQMTQLIDSYSKPLEDGLYHTALDSWLNKVPVTAGKDYLFPNEAFKKAMDGLRSGEELMVAKPALIFNVFIPLGDSGAERVVAVSPDISFLQFHRILQKCFAWQDYHIHEYCIFDDNGNPVARVVSALDDPEFTELESQFIDCRLEKIKLAAYFPNYSKMLYTYDFGDDWLHHIELQEYVPDYAGRLPALLSGEGDAPPEDVGGEGGYLNFIEVIGDDKNPEHEEMLSWATSLGWSHFDFEKVRRRIK